MAGLLQCRLYHRDPHSSQNRSFHSPLSGLMDTDVDVDDDINDRRFVHSFREYRY